jgi:hypothetical protein
MLRDLLNPIADMLTLYCFGWLGDSETRNKIKNRILGLEDYDEKPVIVIVRRGKK